MANYQNNMRYGRQGNMRPMRHSPGMHTGCQSSAPQMDTRCCEPAPRMEPMQREDCGCCAPVPEAKEAAECRERKVPKSCARMMDDPLYGMPIAMAYVPWQTWCGISDICEGFCAGTIFEELNKPFLGRGGWKR
ncbi:spore coat associated protein CotJA [Schaedlerella sp.]|jgi:hypothetical protein|uniref:spore coat associated protein CotJA n=1 Tax=Schaedlerella sp. TaxID=2676057 RepID=UPI001362DF2D|nr:spore coat associated protein CotJA [uncultured Schaedlerella sp.]MCI8768559.1 spore coat associated protein CotJA [Ruminococcus sp.]MCI9329834.1 spore coat associated protein CotJA [Ruminococcus sp.]NBJ01982.1 spore coat associated protein CotJA [Lachnospiraceae bacterium]